jgi:hypothetical protein
VDVIEFRQQYDAFLLVGSVREMIAAQLSVALKL